MDETKIELHIESSQVSFQTDSIIGYLDSILVDSDNKVELIIN